METPLSYCMCLGQYVANGHLKETAASPINDDPNDAIPTNRTIQIYRTELEKR